MIVTPFLAGSFDLIAGEFLARNRKTKTNKRKLLPISANLTRAWMEEWLLSRRDRLIVARHEVPGRDVESLRP